MSRGIEDEIRKNRQTSVKLEGNQYVAPPNLARTVTIPAGAVEITVSATLYTRDLGDALIIGHPAPDHGVSQGVVSDRRGSWTAAKTLDSGDGVFTSAGRQALAEALDGTGTALDTGATGSGTASPSTSDTSLASVAEEVTAWAETPDDQTLRCVADFRFREIADPVEEFGIDADDDTLLARLVTGGVDVALDEEVKIEIDLSFSHSASNAAITDWTSISHALDGGTSVDLAELALGTDDTTPQESDTMLGNQIVSKPASVSTGPNSVSLLAVVLEDEPDTSTYQLQEAGAIRSDGTLVWRVVFAATTKDDERPLQGRSTLALDS